MTPETPRPASYGPAEQVLQIDEVTLNILKSLPPQLEIQATGTVPTSGYTNARLVPYVYVLPPADGIWDFDIVADAPTGPVTQVLQEITAEPYNWPDYPQELRGVRVHAAKNELVRLLETVTVTVVGGPSATVNWKPDLTGQQALEAAYAQLLLTPAQPFTYALQYYGSTLGYLVVMINETYDSFISKGGASSAPFFYWEILVNDQPAAVGIDALVLKPGDVLSFTFVTYDATEHRTTAVGAKHAAAYGK